MPTDDTTPEETIIALMLTQLSVSAETLRIIAKHLGETDAERIAADAQAMMVGVFVDESGPDL